MLVTSSSNSRSRNRNRNVGGGVSGSASWFGAARAARARPFWRYKCTLRFREGLGLYREVDGLGCRVYNSRDAPGLGTFGGFCFHEGYCEAFQINPLILAVFVCVNFLGGRGHRVAMDGLEVCRVV